MISENIPRLHGEKVCLTLFRTDEKAVQKYLRWMSDETTCVFIERNNTVVDDTFMAGWLTCNDALRFNICDAECEDMIGYCHIDHRAKQGAAWLSINIGESMMRGKGYGTDVVKVLLKYCFEELAVASVHLDVLETNEGGIKCYEKCGFQITGRYRKHHIHEGKNIDWLHMDILLEEWEELQRHDG